jgi:CCR4-NOT transcription complex subunit 1
LRKISLLAGQSRQQDDVILAFAQKVVQLLYKNNTALSREVYVMLLEHLCKLSIKVDREVTNWLLYADDEVGHVCTMPT